MGPEIVNNMTNLRALVREIIAEEIGRSYKTTLPPEDSMFNWRSVPGVDANISPDVAHGAWRVVINDEEDEENSESMSFKDETEAKFYARKRSEERLKKMQGEKDFPANFVQYKI